MENVPAAARDSSVDSREGRERGRWRAREVSLGGGRGLCFSLDMRTRGWVWVDGGVALVLLPPRDAVVGKGRLKTRLKSRDVGTISPKTGRFGMNKVPKART